MNRTITISNRKGGSGKTTSAVNIAAALAHRGHTVLLVDTDPQAHATLSLGVTRGNGRDGLLGVLMGTCEPQAAPADTYLSNLKVLPGSRMLADYEREYARDRQKRMVLAERLRDLGNSFEYVVFDTPPTISLLTVASLIASREVYAPMQTHFLALEGLAEIIRVIGQLNRIYGLEIELKGIIPTFYKERTRLSRFVVNEIRENLGDGVLLHPVRVSIALAEAPGHGQTVFQYDLKSNGARDYLAVARQMEDL